jgi:hypothetical protein
MKKLISVTEVAGEGLESLLGEEVILMCSNYFYAGKLVGVNATFVKLDGAHIVYETGPWDAKAWKDSQLIGDGHYVMQSAIESFRKGK